VTSRGLSGGLHLCLQKASVSAAEVSCPMAPGTPDSGYALSRGLLSRASSRTVGPLLLLDARLAAFRLAA